MKIHGDTASGYIANSQPVKSLRITTEPNNLDEFIEMQVAELRDGSLNVVLAVGTESSIGRDSRGNTTLRLWPTAKGQG